jgi:hypothetical protein
MQLVHSDIVPGLGDRDPMRGVRIRLRCGVYLFDILCPSSCLMDVDNLRSFIWLRGDLPWEERFDFKEEDHDCSAVGA